MIDKGVSSAIRNLVAMVTAMYPDNKGAVVLEDQLDLMLSKSRVKTVVNIFMEWYRGKYHPHDTRSEFTLKSDLQKQPPLLVCGILSEFADAVDEAVDVARVATYAAEVVERYGWVQGEAGGKNRGFCLLGALDYAIYHSGMDVVRQQNTWRLTKKLLNELLQTSLLVPWNDAPGRTAGEVTHLLREVAAAGTRTIRP